MKGAGNAEQVVPPINLRKSQISMLRIDTQRSVRGPSGRFPRTDTAIHLNDLFAGSQDTARVRSATDRSGTEKSEAEGPSPTPSKVRTNKTLKPKKAVRVKSGDRDRSHG